jgi:uncharacterized integral membrane protein
MTRHSDAQAPGSKPSRWLSAQVITGLVLAALAVVLVLENRDLVGIRLLLPVVTMPLWTALAAMLLIGAVIGFLVSRPRR